MSGTTFTTFPVASSQTTQAAPRTEASHAATVEQSYLSATAQHAAAPHAASQAGYAPGPGLTTLALGEEDGGMTMPPPSDAGPTPGGDYQVTTLAIGEEDGGGMGAPDPHATIGGHQVAAPDRAGSGFGTMQPIYSPGEAEYPAFVKTSQTPDILNFHPVARIPKTAVPAAAPAATATVSAPASAQPVPMASTPVGALDRPAPQSGNFESVGSYDDYLNGLGGGVAAPSPAPTYADPVPAPSPAYTATEPTLAAPAPAAPMPAPAPTYTAPTESALPQQKPALHGSGALAPAADATYVTVPIDAYLMPEGAATAPAPAMNDAPSALPTAPDQGADASPSMGGSYVVMDAPPAPTEAEAPPAMLGDPETLEIMTLAIGEESSSP